LSIFINHYLCVRSNFTGVQDFFKNKGVFVEYHCQRTNEQLLGKSKLK